VFRRITKSRAWGVLSERLGRKEVSELVDGERGCWVESRERVLRERRETIESNFLEFSLEKRENKYY